MIFKLYTNKLINLKKKLSLLMFFFILKATVPKQNSRNGFLVKNVGAKPLKYYPIHNLKSLLHYIRYINSGHTRIMYFNLLPTLPRISYLFSFYIFVVVVIFCCCFRFCSRSLSFVVTHNSFRYL